MESKKTVHLFETSMHWLEGKKGLLSSDETSGSIAIETPPAFGGQGNPWTPEHFFLGAISSCFMTTFLAFAEKLKFNFRDLDCKAIGQIDIVDGKYKFTQVDLYPAVTVNKQEEKEKAMLAMVKSHKYCLVTNSINCPVYFHEEVNAIEEQALAD